MFSVNKTRMVIKAMERMEIRLFKLFTNSVVFCAIAVDVKSIFMGLGFYVGYNF